MNNPENNENKILIQILIRPMFNFLTIGFIALFTIAYGEYVSKKWPLWVFILVSLLNILWNIFYPLSFYKSLIEDKNILKKMFLCYFILIVCINLIGVMCVNSALGYLPEYVPFLFAPLLIIIARFTSASLKDGQERKKEIKNSFIGLLCAFIIFALIALLFYVCVNNYPLWIISSVLLLNILNLIFIILFDPTSKDPKKSRKRLVFFGFSLGILNVIFILICIHFDLSWPFYVLQALMNAFIIPKYKDYKF